MELLLQQIIAGLATGGIYACFALAVVMIYQAIDHFNFAQGEMAMFSTYVAWQLMAWGLSFWLAFGLTFVFSLVMGAFLYLVVLKPVQNASALSQIVAFIALMCIFNSLAGTIWDYSVKPFPSPFPETALFGALVTGHDLGMIAVTLIMLAGVFYFFKFSTLGLAMRAAAQNPESAQLCGVRVQMMTALGWALAAAIGSVAGMMVAYKVFLEPNMMYSIILYGFAAAIVGGLDSPAGAVAGGFLLGVVENLTGVYVPGGSELKLTFALLLIVVVLMFKPTGLFGHRVVKRV
ncbi:MAG: branched-chain amino acid ABC transporter permease [Rhodobacteraceae bacterium]|jgi:branched-chain amino acid transport system permease protein|nr:branched-chain amino acid ABC transporter permease [Paracoccaceae bacterium]